MQHIFVTMETTLKTFAKAQIENDKQLFITVNITMLPSTGAFGLNETTDTCDLL